MITIGVVYGGPEQRDSEIYALMTAVVSAAGEARGDFEFGDGPAVNVVFYLPGSLNRPDWEGLREGTLSLKEKMLMVQVAVPEEVVFGGTDIDFVIESLHGANAIAFDVYAEHGIEYPLRQAEALVGQIKQIAARSLS